MGRAHNGTDRSLRASRTRGGRILGFVVSAGLVVGLLAAPAAAESHSNDTMPDGEHSVSPWIAAPVTDVTAPVELVARITAPHWFVLEGATGQGIVGFDWQTRRPVASAVKIATALTVIRRTELSDPVIIGDDLPRMVGASVGIRPGQTWTVKDLLLALIGRSGNDVADVLATHVGGNRDAFLELMRADLAEMGLDAVIVSDPSGLDDANRFSAHDLAILGAAALANDELRPLLARFDLGLPDQPDVTSRNLLLDRYTGATGIKTGFTQLAGNVLVGSARRGDREIVAVVLDAAPDPGRFDDTAALLDHAFAASRLDWLSINLEARQGRGIDRWSLADVPLTVPIQARVSLRPIWPTYPSDDLHLNVRVTVNGAEAGLAAAERQPNLGGSDSPPTLGQALADGIYAALRSTAEAGLLR